MTQKTFICLLRNDKGACEQPSPAEMDQMMAKYQAWQDKFADHILDMGSRLGPEGRVVNSEGTNDGPFIELKEVLGGYMMLTATTLDEAAAVIAESPMVAAHGTTIEIREMFGH